VEQFRLDSLRHVVNVQHNKKQHVREASDITTQLYVKNMPQDIWQNGHDGGICILNR